jgi:hypothetical protein
MDFTELELEFVMYLRSKDCCLGSVMSHCWATSFSEAFLHSMYEDKNYKFMQEAFYAKDLTGIIPVMFLRFFDDFPKCCAECVETLQRCIDPKKITNEYAHSVYYENTC